MTKPRICEMKLGRAAAASRLLRALAALQVAALLLAGAAVAQKAPERKVGTVTGLPLPRFVSLKADEVNSRVGPGGDYAIAWVFRRAGLPVEILAEFEESAPSSRQRRPKRLGGVFAHKREAFRGRRALGQGTHAVSAHILAKRLGDGRSDGGRRYYRYRRMRRGSLRSLRGQAKRLGASEKSLGRISGRDCQIIVGNTGCGARNEC